MEFQLAPDIAHLFADAVAAYIRRRADISRSLSEHEAWSTLWATFRDADNATMFVPVDCARLMFWVWSEPDVWRDEQTRLMVRGQLRPQWRTYLAGLPA